MSVMCVRMMVEGVVLGENENPMILFFVALISCGQSALTPMSTPNERTRNETTVWGENRPVKRLQPSNDGIDTLLLAISNITVPDTNELFIRYVRLLQVRKITTRARSQ